MTSLRSILFFIFINAWGTLIPIIYSPAFILRNSKIADHGAKVWAQVSLFMLEKLCGIKHEVIGAHNIPREGCIIACKHQSMWETIVMHLVVNRPVYVYKKELELIPFYGWYLKVMSGIKLNRKGGASALKSLVKQSKEYLKKGQKIIIFPQGTRVAVDATTKKHPYQSGIAALYLSCNVKVVPAALNSGKFWAKHRLGKTSGKIVLEFLEPIETGLPKEEFMKKLENVIEKRSAELI